MNEIVAGLYYVVAYSVMAFLVFVIGQAMDDIYLKRTDPSSVQSARKIAYFVAAAYLLFTLIFRKYWLLNPTVVSVGLVTTGLLLNCIAVLAASSVSMKLRVPPNNNGNRSYSFLSKLQGYFRLR